MRRYFICLLLLSSSLFAEELSVAPTFIEFQNSPGQSASDSVTVFNTSDEPMRVSAYVGDFWYDKQGGRTFPKAGSTPFSAASWISMTQKEFEIPAKGQGIVPFIFAIPPEPPRSSYATLFVERLPQKSKKGTAKTEGSVAISLRVAVPLLFRRPDAHPTTVKLQNFSFLKPSKFKPLILKFLLQNDDDVYLFPEGNVVLVKGTDKQLIAKDEIKRERVVLPKQGVRYEVPLPMSVASGKYEGLLTLFYGENKSLIKNFSFSIP